ncbi:MAG: AAA family ATPase [Myxococcales bacterium]|nr:AAA family ATPase [Myxococcales bacterium]
MNTRELAHFDLTHAPFDKAIADDQLWLPPSKRDIVDALVDTVAARQWALLVGDPGVGKTCILRALRHRLSTDGTRLTYCCNTTLGRRDFYRQICHALNLAPKATAAGVFYAITTNVAELGRDRVHSVFLVDEAHLLHQDVLDHLHILGNFEWDSAPLLSIILVGLPDLEERLALRCNRSIYSRMQRRLRIGPLTPEDTGDYLRTRLAHAGCKKDVFAADARAFLHETAQGALRDLDRLAEAAMRKAAQRGDAVVDRTHVAAAIRDDTPRA